MTRAWLVLALLSVAGCRTSIEGVRDQPKEGTYVPDKECSVVDYPTASEVPAGSKNLGWVQVKTTGNDDETFLLLRQKICEMGGDALSQPAWVREAGEYEP